MPPPNEGVSIELGDNQIFDPGQIIQVDSPVSWIRQRSGHLFIHGDERYVIEPSSGFSPVTHFDWVRVESPGILDAIPVHQALEHTDFSNLLTHFTRHIFAQLRQVISGGESMGREQLNERIERNEILVNESIKALAGTIPVKGVKANSTGYHENAIIAACQMVSEKENIEFNTPDKSTMDFSGSTSQILESVLRMNNLASRRVTLKGSWWKKDNGHFVGFALSGEPLALIRGSRGYIAHNTVLGEESFVDEAFAETIASNCWCFFESLPSHSLGIWDLVKFSF